MHDDDVANGRDTLDENEMFFPSQINDISRYAPDGNQCTLGHSHQQYVLFTITKTYLKKQV